MCMAIDAMRCAAESLASNAYLNFVPLRGFYVHDNYREQKKIERAHASAIKEDKRRDSYGLYIFKKYGMTINDYNHMLLQQQNRCFLCGRKEKLFIDHSHATGKVRRLLCRLCNVGLGHFKDNALLLKRAARYIVNY